MNLASWPESYGDVSFSKYKLITVFAGEFINFLVTETVTELEFFEAAQDFADARFGKGMSVGIVGYAEISEEAFEMLRENYERAGRLVE